MPADSGPPKVFITRAIPEVGPQMLERKALVTVWDQRMPPARETLLKKIQGASGIVTMLSDKVDATFFDMAGEQLKVVANYAVGTNNIDLVEARRRGIAVANTPDVLTEATADLAVSLILSVSRRAPLHAAEARAGEWKTWEPNRHLGLELAGKTLGIYGFGRIGQAVARKLRCGWNMKVIHHTLSPKKEAEAELDAEAVSLDRLLATSDVISLHAPLTEATAGVFDRKAFTQMKDTAVFVNTARGELVVQDDLVEALSSGKIFGAGLDVTTPEPLPPEHPLFEQANCLILPHIGSATRSTREEMSRLVARNILAGLKGDPLETPVG